MYKIARYGHVVPGDMIIAKTGYSTYLCLAKTTSHAPQCIQFMWHHPDHGLVHGTETHEQEAIEFYVLLRNGSVIG